MVIEAINDITFGRDTCLRFGLNELPQNTKTKIYAKNPPRRGEQNPLMWGFIPHVMGKIYAKKNRWKNILTYIIVLTYFSLHLHKNKQRKVRLLIKTGTLMDCCMFCNRIFRHDI